MIENMLEKDSEEGISAFLEKRKPIWDSKTFFQHAWKACIVETLSRV